DLLEHADPEREKREGLYPARGPHLCHRHRQGEDPGPEQGDAGGRLPDFLGKLESEITHIALETLEGHQRAIMALMTVEEIYKDRKKFSEQVFKVASSDLVNMGISVVSYTLKDIHDDQDYLHSLGKARTAQVQKDARMGEAEAKRDAGIKGSSISYSFANMLTSSQEEEEFPDRTSLTEVAEP
ncbi:hypothetical protein KIL84_006145, partial [Mauremys mutica]